MAVRICLWNCDACAVIWCLVESFACMTRGGPFPALFLRLMFWFSLPAPADDYDYLRMKKDEWIDRKTLFDEKTGTGWANEELSDWSQSTRGAFLKHFWHFFVNDKIDLENAIQTKAEFSYALTVMDKIGGWEGNEDVDNQVGLRFGSCLWIFTKAIMLDGSRTNSARETIQRKKNSIIFAVNSVCDKCMCRHTSLSDETLILQEAKTLEALNYDLDVPCVVQWAVLWFAAPSSLNKELINAGLQRKLYYEVIHTALYLAITYPFIGEHTPRVFLLRSALHVLSDMPDNIWHLKREMKGWELGGQPDLLYDNDEENELDSESEEY